MKAQTAVAMEAMRSRFQYERLSHRVHKITVAVLAVEDALEKTGEATEAVAALEAITGDDQVISAALATLPKAVTTRGVPTLRNLQQRCVPRARRACVRACVGAGRRPLRCRRC